MKDPGGKKPWRIPKMIKLSKPLEWPLCDGTQRVRSIFALKRRRGEEVGYFRSGYPEEPVTATISVGFHLTFDSTSESFS